jgi:hypothetical protein
LLEDSFGEQVPWTTRVATAKAGVIERLRSSGLHGDRDDPATHTRAGSLLVLCGWAFFVIAGAMEAKFNEHWADGTPPANLSLPNHAFLAVQVGAGIGLVLVTIAGLIALPALVRALRSSGWALVRRQVRRVSLVAATTAGGGVPVVIWAHHLTSHQRNGGLSTYSAAFLAIGALLTATIAATTASVVSVAAQLKLSNASLRALGLLALAMVATMAVVLAGTITWWAALAHAAPSVLGGRVPLDLILVGSLMTIGMLAGALGGWRVAGSLPRLPRKS